MDTYTETLHKEGDTLAEKAAGTMDTATEVAKEKMEQARQGVTAATQWAKENYANFQDKATNAARSADQMVRDYPYQTLAIALGLGALLGFLLTRRD